MRHQPVHGLPVGAGLGASRGAEGGPRRAARQDDERACGAVDAPLRAELPLGLGGVRRGLATRMSVRTELSGLLAERSYRSVWEV
ncbi:hypothetical protein PLANTIT3_40062 [Plantibacter sp. T3]|nr:hypothetical protein PLANTIT3_40062 [Plantibacter sp. T3]